MSNALPFPAGGITLLLGSPDGGKPTKDWIGTPSEEVIEVFLRFLLLNVATRPPSASGHQTLPIRGRFCEYGFPTPGMRGSDLTRRIYACVRLLELTGETNWQACKRVADYLQDRLARPKRGRRPKCSAPRDLLNQADTVRSLYNHIKRHHRWKEKLSERDLELEHWWVLFCLRPSAPAGSEKDSQSSPAAAG